MKALQIFLVSLVASASSFDLPFSLPKNDPWFVPNFINDSYNWVTRGVAEAELGSMTKVSDLVKYYLYTQENPKSAQQLTKTESSSVQQSNFNGKNPTRIIIHGFQSSYELPPCTILRDTYLPKGPFNIICVDWSEIAKKSYPTARYLVPDVGKDVAAFADFLSRAGPMSIENLIIIGHSLGAHVSGFAGKSLQNYNMKVPLIIGCDPALPLFDYDDCSSRLCATDAAFVETIQTCGGKLGFLKPIGTGSYYPNGGEVQPGCGFDVIGVCAHLRSYEYLAEAIALNDFPTIKCNDYQSAVLKQCGSRYGSAEMGSESNKQEQGIFYVPVNDKPNYGKGAKI